MTAKAFSSLAAGFALALALMSSATAEPATEADLSGKKICWDSGNVSSFLPDGKYSSPVIGDGTWSMTAHGVEIHTPMLGVILDIDRQADGTFRSKMEKATGKYCE
jgi:hypothetical protein